jgi:hypothetical protein
MVGPIGERCMDCRGEKQLPQQGYIKYGKSIIRRPQDIDSFSFWLLPGSRILKVLKTPTPLSFSGEGFFFCVYGHGG